MNAKWKQEHPRRPEYGCRSECKMETKTTSSPQVAASFILSGSLAAFPTETVYGLGANAFDDAAVKKIFKAKGRPKGNPLIVHIHSKIQIKKIASKITPAAKKIISKFFPGPISIVLPKTKLIPSSVTANLSTVCIRMPSLKIAQSFLRACKVPVAAPSANLSGSPSPTTWRHVLHDLGGKIPVILKGPPAKHGLESTVIDCTKKIPVLLRAGSLPLEKIESIVGHVEVARGAKIALSPGMKYRHYAPKAKVIIVASALSIPKNARSFAYIGSGRTIGEVAHFRPKDDSDYAKNLFSFFRKCDSLGVKAIYAQKVGAKGIGRAIMERLRKAAKG